VWEIPHVKAAHVEKTIHTCQFPIALVIRLIQALSQRGAIVLDPFSGSGTTGAAAILTGRRFIGAEMDVRYVDLAKQRMLQAYDGRLPYRPLGKPLRVPNPREAVSRMPDSFLTRDEQ
jgi:adenine-specific DNA-methyltransferase